MKHPELIKLGQHIRQLRKQKGYTQENFADVATIDRSYYGSIERGEHNLTYLQLLKIIKCLGFKKNDEFKNIQDFFNATN